MIPAEAVEAAHEQLDAMGAYVSKKYVEAALEAAAPYMLPDFRESNQKAIAEELANPLKLRRGEVANGDH